MWLLCNVLRTVDGVHDLAVSPASPALLYFRVIDLKQVIHPRNELIPRFTHLRKTRKRVW